MHYRRVQALDNPMAFGEHCSPKPAVGRETAPRREDLHDRLPLEVPFFMPTSTSLLIEQVDIDQLRPDPANPRAIDEAELESLTRSIREFDLVQPVLARAQDKTIIAGHGRVRAARRGGLSKVPVIWLDLSIERARLLGLALNKISGTWDEQLLARMLAELGASPGVDLTLSGFSDDEMRRVLRDLDAREKRDWPEAFDLEAEIASVSQQPRTKRGDLWLLADHRLLCGDATSAADVDRLLSGARPAMAFTDPPYNVALGDHGGQPREARRRRMANDDLDAAGWERFVGEWARLLVQSVDGALYICMSSKEWPTVARLLAEAGGHWSDTLIWAKDRFVLGRADYQRAYEPIWYGWREGAKHRWCGDRDQGDVWHIARPSDAPLHPVMKPLPLMERAIANSSRSGDLVMDPFAGSGSTIIACERTGRICAALEIDPVYVDAAVARWERFTGGKAVRSDG